MSYQTGIARNLACLAVAILTVACAPASTTIKRIYENTDHTGPFERFLVVGVSEDRVTRGRFERAMVAALAEQDISANPSGRIMGSEAPVNRKTVAAAAGETRSDIVLVARLRSVKTEALKVEGRSGVKVTRKDDTLADFFRYDYEEIADPERFKVSSTVVVATDAYAVESGEKIWTVESTTMNEGEVRDLIDSMSHSIVRQLQRDGLAR